MQQIDLKDYPSRFSLSGYPVTKVAVNFDSSTRTVKVSAFRIILPEYKRPHLRKHMP